MRRRLQAVRIATAWVVGILFAALFLGPSALVDRLVGWLPRTQAVPALFSLLAAGSLAGGLVLGGVVASSLLAGRLYCAAGCPLGVLQDALAFLVRRIPWVRRWHARRAGRSPRLLWRRRLRWGVLAVTTATAAMGSWLLVVLLEPYGLFGRFAVLLGAPVTAVLRRLLSSVLERADVFVLSAPTAVPPVAGAVLATGAFLVGLVAMVIVAGRLYCTALCPVGTCLGLLAQVAPWRVRIDAEACTGCGLCVRRCRSACIQIEADGVHVEPSACVACMDCLAVCPTGAIRYGTATAPRPVVDPVSPARRELLSAGVSAAVAAAATPARGWVGQPPDPSAAGPVSPPGSGDRQRFTSRCTACQLCVQACPTHVLQAATLEYGLAGVLQPRLSFRHGFCEFECQRCTAVCPTGALLPLDLDEKKRTQLGVARLYKDRCIVYCRGEECGACVEVCPTHAVYSYDREGLLCPEMAHGSCIGCGACEFACPVAPKAIEVHASPVHGRAAPPHAAPTRNQQPAAPPPTAGTAKDSGFPF